MNSLNHPNLTK